MEGFSFTLLLVIITGFVTYMTFNNRNLYLRLKHHPFTVKREKEYDRLLTSGFLHIDWTHAIMNLYVLYEFGRFVEAEFVSMYDVLGNTIYLVFYLLAIIFSSIPSQIKHKDNAYYSAVGASGGVSAILLAQTLFDPWAGILLFFIIPMPIFILAIGYLWYSSWAAKNRNDNIGHDAHFFGAVFGFTFPIILKPSLFFDFIDKLMAGVPF